MLKEISPIQQLETERSRLSGIKTQRESLVDRIGTDKVWIGTSSEGGALNQALIGSSFEATLKVGRARKTVRESIVRLNDRLEKANQELLELQVYEENELSKEVKPEAPSKITALAVQTKRLEAPQKIIVNDNQKEEYKKEIMPFVLAARETHNFLRDNPSSETKEEFRRRVNKLIVQVNEWRARTSIDAGAMEPTTAGLISNPQIPTREGRNKFLRPDSPVRPHNSLGKLPIYREGRARDSRLVDAVRRQSKILTPSNFQISEMSLAVIRLVPDHFIITSQSTPLDLRTPDYLAKSIVGISILVIEYDNGILQPPTAEEVGLPGKDQDRFIAAHLRSLLAHFLRDELTNPNRTETQFQDFYQELNKYVRELARHITPIHGNVDRSYERLGGGIEDLPGIEGDMFSARLSTSLYQDLGLPCIGNMGEVRIAEVIRNIGMSGYRRYDYESRSSTYTIPEKRRILLEKIVDSLCERIETGGIDCQKLFGPLEDLDYGEVLISRIFEIALSEQKDVLLRALRESNCFGTIIDKLEDEDPITDALDRD